MTAYTPLDSLKEVTLLVGDLIEMVQERLSDPGIGDDDMALEILDSARRELVLALSHHIPGIAWPPGAIAPTASSSEAVAAQRTFDDGTPVRKPIALAEYGDEYLAYWWPRRDGSLEKFKSKMLELRREQTATLVDDVDPMLVEAVEDAFAPDEGEDG